MYILKCLQELCNFKYESANETFPCQKKPLALVMKARKGKRTSFLNSLVQLEFKSEKKSKDLNKFPLPFPLEFWEA